MAILVERLPDALWFEILKVAGPITVATINAVSRYFNNIMIESQKKYCQ